MEEAEPLAHGLRLIGAVSVLAAVAAIAAAGGIVFARRDLTWKTGKPRRPARVLAPARDQRRMKKAFGPYARRLPLKSKS